MMAACWLWVCVCGDVCITEPLLCAGCIFAKVMLMYACGWVHMHVGGWGRWGGGDVRGDVFVWVFVC